MRQHSDDQQGFIPSDFEIKNKINSRIASLSQTAQLINTRFRVNYRFASSFIKKEHPRVWNTPLTIPEDPLNIPPFTQKHKPIVSLEHPFKFYSSSHQFQLLYSRNAGQPLLYQKQYMKNEVSLFSFEDKNSPSLKQIKSFEQEPTKQLGDDLAFDSRFQSGNLHCAFRKRGTQQYHLFMSNDTNTMGYNQWFYFSVTNMQKKTKYIFRIVNYRKKLEFFKQGQRIAMFSLREAEQGHNGWRRVGNKYSFEQSNVRSTPDRKQFVLSFQLQFPNDSDYVLLASSVPYSYSKLIRQLYDIQNEANNNKIASFRLQSAGTTLCNNEIPEVTISARSSSKSEKSKRMIVILARQHPGEVWSSYVAEGIMRSLLKDTPENQYLLENYLIKVFPMVNVDGVIYGNFRCDVTGVDLNRRWRQPSRVFHPQIFQLKKKINSFSKKWRIDLCLDLHGHSKKYNIFCYACKHNSYTCRILPLLIQNQSHLFNMPSCTFGLSRDKETTARATISRIIKSQNVLTIETSTFGWRSNLTPIHYNPLDLYKFAEQMMKSVRYFVDKKSSRFLATEKNIKQNFSKFQQYDQQNQEQSGSDSEPEQDEIDFKIKIGTIFDKKYQNQQKCFLRQDAVPPLHLAHLIFQENAGEAEKKDEVMIHEKEVKQLQNASQVMVAEQKKNERGLTFRQPRSLKNDFSVDVKKSLSIKHSDIGRDIDPMGVKLPLSTSPKDYKAKIMKKIIVRDKKKYSFLHQPSPRQNMTLYHAQTIEDEVGRLNLYQQYQRQEQKKRMDNFVSRFQRFIPSSFAKGKGKFQMLQQGLDKDDTSYQLNIMLENKRRIELQRIRRSIEDSTEIAQRQGRLKMMVRKDPIIDFKRFKQHQKLKQQLKKLGEYSQRYLQGYH